MSAAPSPTDRTRVRRLAELAAYDPATLNAIVDAAYLCHVAFSDQHGTHCIPTACWREGSFLHIHGANGGRMLKHLLQGGQACVTITHLDGLVLAKSAFNHTMNYRSAIIYGCFERIDDDAAKRASMDVFMEKIAPGRLADARPGNDKEFAATSVLRISLEEAACKVRSGGPADDTEDMALQPWTGVLPLGLVRGTPKAHGEYAGRLPDYVSNWNGAGQAEQA